MVKNSKLKYSLEANWQIKNVKRVWTNQTKKKSHEQSERKKNITANKTQSSIQIRL